MAANRFLDEHREFLGQLVMADHSRPQDDESLDDFSAQFIRLTDDRSLGDRRVLE